MKTLTKNEKKIYSITGSIYGCLISCYMIIVYLFHGVPGIIATVPNLTFFGMLFGAIMSICSMILYIRRLITTPIK